MRDARKQFVGPEFVALPGEQTECYRRDLMKGASGNRWVEVPHEQLLLEVQEYLTHWFTHPLGGGAEIVGGSKTVMWTRSDALDATAHVKSDSIPPGFKKLAYRDRERAFNLDTGKLIHGVPFADCFVEVQPDGELIYDVPGPRDFVRWCTGFDFIRDAYDPPPAFAEWLEFLLPHNPADQLSLRTVLGALLAGELPKLQAMLLLIGEGGTGKGTLQRLINEMHGGDAVYNVRSPIQLSTQFALASLRGKHILTVSDMSRRPSRGSAQDNFDAGMGALKNITGGDPVDVEPKFQRAQSRILDVSVVVGSNFQPRWIVGTEDASAWSRRLLPFRFDRKPEQPEQRFLENVLLPELPQIASHCLIQYALLLQRVHAEGRALGAGDLRSEAMQLRIQSIVEAAKGEAGMFVEQCVEFTDSEEVFVTRRQLAAALEQFLGLDDGKLSDSQRNAMLREIENTYPDAESKRKMSVDPVSGRKAQERGYTRLRIVEDADSTDDDIFDAIDGALDDEGEQMFS